MATVVELRRVSSGLFRLTVFRTEGCSTRAVSNVTGRLLGLCKLAEAALLSGAEADARSANISVADVDEEPPTLRRASAF
jgi:hypothetical protein